MNNDLISRERLKNTILLGNYDTQSKILSAIDNAPTVDIKDQIAGAYNEGYMCGNKEAEKARPQGEWENDSDNLPICNKCGEIALQRIFVKMPHLIQDVRMVRSNYCPNCGADMRKPNCVTCDHFGKCKGCEKGEEE